MRNACGDTIRRRNRLSMIIPSFWRPCANVVVSVGCRAAGEADNQAILFLQICQDLRPTQNPD